MSSQDLMPDARFFASLRDGDEVVVEDQIGHLVFSASGQSARLRVPIPEGSQAETAANLETLIHTLNDALLLAGFCLVLDGVEEADHPDRGRRLFRSMDELVGAMDVEEVVNREEQIKRGEPPYPQERTVGDTFIFVYRRLA